MAAYFHSSNKCMGQYINVWEVSIQKSDFPYTTIWIDSGRARNTNSKTNRVGLFEKRSEKTLEGGNRISH